MSQQNIAGLLNLSGKPAEALSAFETALAIKQALVDAHPTVTEFQSGVATMFRDIGQLKAGMGKPAEALASLEKARAIHQSLVDANREVVEFQYLLALDFRDLGDHSLNLGRLPDALGYYESAGRILRALVDANPANLEYPQELAMILGSVGKVNLEFGRLAQAADGYRKAAAIQTRLPPTNFLNSYNAACSYALLAGLAGRPSSGLSVSDGRTQADMAMTWLRKAVAAGFRHGPALRMDPDLNALRSRPDFQLLMMDVLIPENAFGGVK
jgi:tetratricopeptide (TPR) repeat protein